MVVCWCIDVCLQLAYSILTVALLANALSFISEPVLVDPKGKGPHDMTVINSYNEFLPILALSASHLTITVLSSCFTDYCYITFSLCWRTMLLTSLLLSYSDVLPSLGMFTIIHEQYHYFTIELWLNRLPSTHDCYLDMVLMWCDIMYYYQHVYRLEVLGVSEMRWTGQGQFSSDGIIRSLLRTQRPAHPWSRDIPQ